MNSAIHSDANSAITAEKKRLRQHYKTQRLGISATTRMQTAEAIASQLLSLPEFSQANYIAGYWASFGEVPLHILQMRLRPPQIWCLPMVAADSTLKFSPWRAGDPLVSNQYGIPEPDVALSSAFEGNVMRIVLMPLLAYTRSGQRLGMGGGYYDRSFAATKRNPSTRLIGVAYSSQEADTLPSEPWDVKLDMLVNAQEVLRF